jgi:hypothetical protein
MAMKMQDLSVCPAQAEELFAGRAIGSMMMAWVPTEVVGAACGGAV